MGKASTRKRVRRGAPTLYHFTSVYHLTAIEASGFIGTTESNLSFQREHVGPPVVWLLDTPTADDAPHGLDGSAVNKRGVRIAVRTKAERWVDWVARQPNADAASKDVLIRTGGGPQAASHWWVTEQRIPRSEWESVQILVDK
jgi:hypothetical protein